MNDSPWQHRGHPAVVAHRGAANRYPENTLVALAAAVAGGVRFLEFDIQLSADEVPVLCHDPDLKRTAGLDLSVLDQPWPRLRDIAVGETARLGPRHREVPLVSLADTVAHLNRWPETVSFVEIKRHSVARFGAQRTVARTTEVLADLTRPYVMISFVADVIRQARLAGVHETGWVLRAFDEAHRNQLQALRPDYVFCNADHVPDEGTLWPGPWSWVIYEIDSPADAHLWRQRGADMVESMAAIALLALPPYCAPVQLA